MNKIYLTRRHKMIEIISYVLFAISFIIVIFAQKTLPDRIPTHYDLAGNVDGYGSPVSLFLLPGTMILANLIISFVVHFVNPDFWNMPFKVKKEKKNIVYRDMISMMLWMELEMAGFTLGSTIMAYVQNGAGAGLLTILLMFLFAVTIIGFCILAAKHNK